jgi:hypothetical protein
MCQIKPDHFTVRLKHTVSAWSTILACPPEARPPRARHPELLAGQLESYFDFRRSKWFFLCVKFPDRSWGPSLLFNAYRSIFLRVRECNCSLPFLVRVKKEWSYIPHPAPYVWTTPYLWSGSYVVNWVYRSSNWSRYVTANSVMH